MHRVRGLLVLALLLIPTVSHAIQLHWSLGADTLTLTEATRAILVLRADSLDGSRVEGRRTVDWDLCGRDGRKVSPGVYFARLTGCGVPRAVRVVVIR